VDFLFFNGEIWSFWYDKYAQTHTHMCTCAYVCIINTNYFNLLTHVVLTNFLKESLFFKKTRQIIYEIIAKWLTLIHENCYNN